jgi:hypothetical protein
MKISGLFFCICLAISSCRQQTNFESLTAEVKNDADYKLYKLHLRKGNPKKGFSNYVKLHKRYIETGKLSSEELKSILVSDVASEMAFKK